jgi:Putative zinc-finger
VSHPASPDYDTLRRALGVYVLGSIDPAERALVDRHLADCESCRDEVASLAGIPGLLGRLTEPEVVALAAPPAADGQLLDRILAASVAAHRRTRRRRVLAAVAAFVLLCGGVGTGAAIVAAGHRSAPPAALSLSSVTGGVSAHAALTARAWGTAVDLRLAGVPGGHRCRVLAVSRDGTTDPVASYESTYAGTTTVTGASALQLAEISALRIIDTEGDTLVTMSR